MARQLRVYAAGSNVPISVCRDARLRAGSAKKDETYGQFGWDYGINYSNFHRLALVLVSGATKTPPHTCDNYVWDCPPPRAGEVSELAVQAHGEPGIVDVDCTSTNWYKADNPVDTGLRVATMWKYHAHFALLDAALAENGRLYFMSCRAGQGVDGTKLLIEVSRLLPKREIIAYTTMGFSSGGDQSRPGNHGFAEPGMRDTPFPFPSPTPIIEDARYPPLWNDLKKMPWASRHSPHAKVVKDGKIIKLGEPPIKKKKP